MPFRTKKTDIWQYDIVIGGRRFRGSTGTSDWEAAKAVEADIRASATTEANRGGTFTLSEALGTYYRDKAQHQPSARTTRSQAKGLLQLLGAKKKLTSITNGDILEFVARRRSEVSNATVNRQLQLLGRALRHMGKLYQANVPDIDLRAAENKEPKERVREMSRDEQSRLFQHLRPDLHSMVQFALMTGARKGTICNLLWSDVDIDNSEMTFQLKGGDSMIFPISAEMRAMLGSLPRSNTISERRFVFTYVDKETAERKRINHRGGGIYADFRKAVDVAEIDDFRFHDFRHTFATRMLR